MVRFGGAGVKLLLTHLCLGSAPLGRYRHKGVGVTQPRKPTCFSLSQAASSPFTLNDAHEPLLFTYSVPTPPYFPFPNLLIFIGKKSPYFGKAICSSNPRGLSSLETPELGVEGDMT